ncbi:MAG TPA: formylglycine-generating enzyme family protein, partial [Lamprocystis sp. (in: g-proteobacteria)]|nr:formylglycine-generating enzyme family protein [Lamprocystis sp. (in: g-proteobacteria)]
GRPGRVEVAGYVCPMVFLSLFDDDQVDAYLCKRFPDTLGQRLMARDNPVRLRAAAVVKSMQSLRFRPLLLAHIEDIIEAGERDWNPYSLYEFLVNRWLGREERKLRGQLQNPPDKETLWRICAAVATHLQERGARVVEPADLEALVAAFPAVAALEHFNVGGRSLMNRNAGGAYRFSHYSIQEFLVVHDLVQAPDRLDGPPIRVTAEMLGFLNFADAMPPLGRLDLSGVQAESLAVFGFRDRLTNGTAAPLMNLIPTGTFRMGSADSDKRAYPDEGPRHEVRIARPFAIGRYPVTFDEYDRFCADTRRERPDDQGWGRGARPVIKVSWDDAVAYCQWLSRQTGKDYRLPTEAEWEYACRAGTETRWSFGDDESALAEHAWFDTNSGGKTQPVGEKRPNPWGLYDVHGNVWEWVQDAWHDNYQGAPDDGSAWHDAEGEQRVVRGGSWGNQARYCRSARRDHWEPGYRFDNQGFRLARGPEPASQAGGSGANPGRQRAGLR